MKVKFLFSSLILFPSLFIFYSPLTSCSEKIKSKGIFINNNDFYFGTEHDTLKIENYNNEKITNVDIIDNSSHNSILNEYFLYSDLKNTFKVKKIPNETIDAHILLKNNKNVIELSSSQSSTIHIHNQIDIENYNAIKTFIHNISFSLRGTTGYSSVRGTGWIIGKESESDNYFLLTNWHVQLGLDEVGGLKDWKQDDGSNYYAFKNTTKIGQSRVFSPNNYDNIASDVSLYKVSFKDDLKPTNLMLINEYCSFNSNFVTKLHNNTLTDNQLFFIGGYPVNKSSGKAEFHFVPCRLFEAQGYKDRNWYDPDPKEYLTMSHFMSDKKKYSVANDILMQPLSCDELVGGASGSIVLSEQKNIIGIYWGGRTLADSNAYCGNIETLGNLGTNNNFTDYSLNPKNQDHVLFNQLKTVPLSL